MISPFVNSSALYDIGNIDLENYTKNNSNTTNVNHSSENAGIHSIGLTLSRKNIEKVEIDFSNKNDEKNTNEEEQIRDDIAKYYEIDKNLINVKIK